MGKSLLIETLNVLFNYREKTCKANLRNAQSVFDQTYIVDARFLGFIFGKWWHIFICFAEYAFYT